MPSNLHKVSFSKPVPPSSVDWRTLSQRPYETKQRANSHRRPVVEEEDSQDQLFHTICGTSNAFSLPRPQNVYWFVLEESVIDLFKNEGHLEDGKLRKTHEIVKSLLDSDFGVYASVYERLKSQLLPKAMAIIRANVDESNYLPTLELAWDVFFGKILPTLECMLYLIESPKAICIRKAALVAFRDHILIVGPLEEKLREQLSVTDKLGEASVHMVLVVQAVCECFPPSKNKLEMERIAGLVVSPYLGFRGLYLERDNVTPVVRSNEPELARPIRKRASLEGGERLSSRPLLLTAHRPARLPSRKVSLQPVLEKKSSHNSLNYLMARIYK